MPTLSINRDEISAGRTRLRPVGDLDRETFKDFSAVAVEAMEKAEVVALWVDLTGITTLSPAGAGVFLALAPRAEELGKRLVIYGLPEPLSSVAMLYGLPALTNMYDDFAAAAAGEGA